MADKVGRDEKMDPFLKITLSIKPYFKQGANKQCCLGGPNMHIRSVKTACGQ